MVSAKDDTNDEEPLLLLVARRWSLGIVIAITISIICSRSSSIPKRDETLIGEISLSSVSCRIRVASRLATEHNFDSIANRLFNPSPYPSSPLPLCLIPSQSRFSSSFSAGTKLGTRADHKVSAGCDDRRSFAEGNRLRSYVTSMSTCTSLSLSLSHSPLTVIFIYFALPSDGFRGGGRGIYCRGRRDRR